MNILESIYPTIDGHLGSFQKSIMNSAAMSILIHVFSEIYTFMLNIYFTVELINH